MIPRREGNCCVRTRHEAVVRGCWAAALANEGDSWEMETGHERVVWLVMRWTEGEVVSSMA